MSKCSALLCIMLLLGAASAHAQERIVSAPAELSVARRARGDSLAAIERDRLRRWELRHALLLAKGPVQATAEPEPLDTVRVDGLVLTRAPADSSLPIARAGASAWRLLQQRYGEAAGVFVQAPIRVVRRDTAAAVQEVAPGTAVVDEDASIDEMGLRIADRVLVPALDARLLQWVDGALPLDPPSRGEIEARYRRLALDEEDEARSCFAGRADACRRAFGFGDVAALYPTLADRQRAVRRLQVSNLGPWKMGAAACLGGDAEWCDRVLADASMAVAAIAMAPAERQDVARFAIHAGGPKGYLRLLDAHGSTIEAQLAAAAGVPFDTVLVRWRTAVVAGRPLPMTLRPMALLAACVWIAAAVLAAAGSSRWRLG